VTASLIEAGIVSLNLVSHFEIFPPTISRCS
jgi:pyruvoyl-dependent arginine decarboxylase (PvlArgDC)